jgi:hypothetical protein
MTESDTCLSQPDTERGWESRDNDGEFQATYYKEQASLTNPATSIAPEANFGRSPPQSAESSKDLIEAFHNSLLPAASSKDGDADIEEIYRAVIPGGTEPSYEDQGGLIHLRSDLSSNQTRQILDFYPICERFYEAGREHGRRDSARLSHRMSLPTSDGHEAKSTSSYPFTSFLGTVGDCAQQYLASVLVSTAMSVCWGQLKGKLLAT